LSGYKSAMDAVSKIDLSGYKSAMDAVPKIDLSGYKSAMDAVSKIDLSGYKSAMDAVSKIDLSGYKSAMDAVPKIDLSGYKSAMDAVSRIDLSGYKSAMDAVSKISSNWVLTDSVVNAMSLENKEKETKYIFGKIPKDTYQLCQSFNDDSEKLEYILENKENTESIPVREIPRVLAITDIVTSLSTKDVFSLYRYLAQFPMLGLEHAVGRRIFDEINTNLITVEKLTLFRARDRDANERKLPYTDLEMFKAPYGVSGQGRYNISGQGELYTCDVKEVALSEIASDNPNLRYDIIEWQLSIPVKFLDLSNSQSPLVQYCSFEKTTRNGQEYIFPNFLAQCAKYHGVHGIVYRSVASPQALNYVFFDYEQNWFKTIDFEFDIVQTTNTIISLK
ncbi:RES family NAD+ phosphorylase, partial [Bacillus paranthracis]